MASLLNNRGTCPPKAWLAEFLLTRAIFNGPIGKPLYSYQVTAQEYDDLRNVLSAYRGYAFHVRHEYSWAACFCLFVAECFRREYDGGDGGWSWSRFEKRLGCSFNPQQHATLVERGLERYWKRPIRQRERGRDLLGSLFAEGGLPWALVQSDSHGFGRSVRKGIKDYYRAQHFGRTTTDLMGDCEQYLPQTFRTLETRQLLAGIVEQLMHLAEQHSLREHSDPAAYLDKCSKGWRTAFPIPLDESNARGLINEWLKDAGQRRQERKEEEEKAHAFTCTHFLEGEVTDWCVQTEAIIPKTTTFPLAEQSLTSTRMEMCFYEGDRLLAKGGVVYGHIAGDQISVRFPIRQIQLRRCAPQHPLSMQLLENGKAVHVFHFSNSTLEYRDLPLIFEAHDNDWRFVASASCRISGARVRIRLPSRFKLVGGTVAELGRDRDGGLWLEARESLQLKDELNLITVRLSQQDDAASRPELHGKLAPYQSTPSTVYIGWPRLTSPDGNAVHNESLTVYADGRPVTTARMRTQAGHFRYSVRNADGDTVLQRRFGILPEDFQLHLQPALADRPARLQIRPADLHVRVVDHNLYANTELKEQQKLIHLHPVGKEIPTTFTVEISNDVADAPVLLHLPFPYQGARLIGSDEAPLETRDVTLDELGGMRIALSAGRPYRQQFTVDMELISPAERRLQRRYYIDVGSMPVMLNLFSYQNDMVQMLGAVNVQDAYIRLTVEAGAPLLSFNVRRYNGLVHWLSPMSFEIVENSSTRFKHHAKPAAMLLSDPRQAPLALPERVSEGVETGIFLTTASMERSSPWLIYPDRDSGARFRPVLYIPSGQLAAPNPSIEEADTAVKRVNSMHEAARLYHPQHQPHVIEEQIAAMAADFGHSGWQYVLDIKTHYAHLPLSTFESWRALARCPEALAAFVFRLEIDENFCGRIRDELAVVWECIPLPLWSATYQRYRAWLALHGFPEALQQNVLQNRKAVLPAVVSGFDYVGNFLETGDASSLRKVPIEQILPGWYQSLRRTHEANDRWPTELGSVLASWVQSQHLPPQVKSLSQTPHTDAVSYLPIFMAYVTAGKARLEELRINTAYLKFAIKMISDFDRSAWYACVHAMMVSYLLALDVH